jgi:hypothetical protein
LLLLLLLLLLHYDVDVVGVSVLKLLQGHICLAVGGLGMASAGEVQLRDVASMISLGLGGHADDCVTRDLACQLHSTHVFRSIN